jgi:hypothetical protein
MTDPEPRTSRTDILGWGAFLASSWTWCIGMFLPVLLIRDFGLSSFLVFAIPNVLGAALMGAVLQRPGLSESIVRAHGKACWAFSFVTVSFQVFFLCWLILGLEPSVNRWALAPMLLVVLFTGRGHVASSWTRLVAILVLITSLTAGAWWASHAGPVSHIDPPRLPTRDLLWLGPVCTLGFGLCPYLDLTFHTARQKAPGPAGTAAFALGFGVLFASMILLTLLYSGKLLEASQSSVRNVQPGLAATPIILHMTVQLIFTVMLHKDWIEADPSPAGPKAPANASLLALVLGVVAAIVSYRVGPVTDLAGPEVAYRVFMAFYGLVFPAYVWTCIVPSGGRSPSRPRLVAFAAAVLIAAPMYWLGFVQGPTWWLGPGVLVVLLAGLIPREPSPSPG